MIATPGQKDPYSGTQGSSSVSMLITPSLEKYTQSVPNNSSNELAEEFLSWYVANVNANITTLHNVSQNKLNTVFSSFLSETPSATRILKNITAQESTQFQKQDEKMGQSILNSINNGKLSQAMELHGGFSKGNMSAVLFSSTKNGSAYYLFHAASLPNRVLMPIGGGGGGSGSGAPEGRFVMVSVNYFVFTAPWELGGWSVTYGEHDVINAYFAGDDAQSFYNQVSTSTTWSGLLYALAVGVLGVAIGIAAPTLGLSVVAGAVIASALVALAFTSGALASMWVGDLTSLYESTYANEPDGSKYIWTFATFDYYYPWITVVGALDSSVGMYGYLSNNNVVTFVPNIPIDLTVVASMSSYIQDIGNSVGWNSFAYTGDY